MKSTYEYKHMDKKGHKAEGDERYDVGAGSTYDTIATNELIHKVKQGDVKAKEKLLDIHQNFTQGLVKNFKEKIQFPVDELQEAARIGLVKAALDFDTTKSLTFMAWSVWFVNKQILESIHGLHPKRA